MILKGFYFITDNTLTRQGIADDVKNALAAGVAAVQYRNKQESKAVMIEEAKKIRQLCPQTLFIVNDFLDVALASDANGVHIGQSDITYAQARKALGPEKIIGVSVDTVLEAQMAQDMGADYLGVGPIFATSTKKDAASPCGTKVISDIRKKCSLPIVAIGGITLQNALDVVDAGADSLCAISATVGQPDMKSIIQQFNKIILGSFRK
jgi:thiamine-phosphate pyrophosphorylase